MGLGAGCPGENCANKKKPDELVELIKTIGLSQFEEDGDYCECGKALASEKEQRDGVCRLCL